MYLNLFILIMLWLDQGPEIDNPTPCGCFG